MVDRSLTLGTLFTANVQQFIAKIDLMKRKVGQLNATMASIGKQTKGLGTATGAVDKMGKSMDKTTKSSKGFSAQMGFMGKALTNVGMAAKTTASFFAAGLAIGTITKGLAAGTKEIIDFDQALKNLQAITKSTDTEVAGMGEVIKQVATETKFSTGEVSEGMVLLGQAGFSVTEAMQSMSSVANLATGTLSNLRVTSDLLTTTIRAFNLSTVESARVADVMANAINRSKLTIDKLRIAFNFVGAASAQAGLSLEETAASMMVLANNGLRASTIGTGLRQVMSRLLSPNRKLREEFKEQGIALEQINPSLVGWSAALKNLIPILVDTETGLVNMSKAYQLFGLRGAQAAAILAKAVTSGDYQKMIEYTMEVGSAARMAATQMEGLGVKLKNLADRMKIVAVAIGEAGLTDALKLLIDTLRAAAEAVADFASSNLGQVVLALVGWTVVVGGTIKSIGLLTKAVKAAGKALKSGFLAGLTGVGSTAVATSGKISGLALKVVRLIGKFSGAGFVIGAVVTIMNRFVTSIERQITSLEKYDTKTQTVIQTLGLFQSKLEDLEKKREKDVDISKEHAKEVERFQQAIKGLEKDYDALEIALDKNSDALEDNIEATEALKKVELEKTIRTNLELVDEYNKQIERSKYWHVVWQRFLNSTVGWIKQLGVELKYVGGIIREFGSKGVDWLAKKLEDLGPIGEGVVAVFRFIAADFKGLWDNIEARIDSVAASYKGQSDKIVKITESQRLAYVRAAKAYDELYRGTRSIDEIIEEIETLKDIKLDPKTIDAINEALKRVTNTLQDQKDEWNETFDSIPDIFTRTFDKMDIARKVDTSKLLKKLAKDATAWEKQARILGATDAEINAGRIELYARGIAAAEEAAEKEVEISEKAAEKTLEGWRYLEEETERIYNQASAQVINRYLSEYDEAAKSKEGLIKLEKQFAKEMETVVKTREESLGAIEARRKGLRTQLEKQTIKTIRDLNAKMYKDLQKQLKSRLKSAEDDLKATQENIDDLEEERRKSINEFNEASLSDEGKWLADREEAYYLFNKARETGDKEFYSEAKAAAKSLEREVTDSDGRVIRTRKQNAEEARGIYLEIINEQISAQRRLEAEQKRGVREYKASIEDLRIKFTELKSDVDKLSSTELKLKMDKTLEDLNEAHEVTSDFREEWDGLKSKDITLTVHYKYVGKSSSGISTEEEGTSTIPQTRSEQEAAQRWGGIIRRKLGGAIRQAFDIGGKLRGYGGGDKVRALLEPGEYVVRKEAVKKYGEGVFSALNNMRVGSEDVGTTVAQRIGGIIKKATYQPQMVQAFATGGPVASASSSEPPRAINIYLQPKFLTGDRRSMRVAAAEIQRALTDLDTRWGKR